MSLQLPIPPVPARSWGEVGRAAQDARVKAELPREAAADKLDVTVDDLVAFEAGEPSLGMFEIEMLAGVVGSSIGELFYGDCGPMFRGEDDAREQAERAAAELMTEFLEAEALDLG